MNVVNINNVTRSITEKLIYENFMLRSNAGTNNQMRPKITLFPQNILFKFYSKLPVSVIEYKYTNAPTMCVSWVSAPKSCPALAGAAL